MSLSSLIVPLRPLPTPGSLLSTISTLQSLVLKAISNADPEADDDEVIDEWEKGYTQGWLTKVVKTASELIDTDDEVEGVGSQWEEVATEAGKLMGLLTGGMSVSQPFTRTYAFPFNPPSSLSSSPHVVPESPIRIEIQDAALSYAAIGSQTWNAAPLLCRKMCERVGDFFPQLFTNSPSFPTPADMNMMSVGKGRTWLVEGVDTPPFTRPSTPALSPPLTAPARHLRILELGSGTGLVGLLTAALLRRLLPCVPHNWQIELILTDYHPTVLENLQHNVRTNQHLWNLPAECGSVLDVKVEKLDWRIPGESSVKGTFEIILGSDLVYEPRHAWWCQSVVRRFLAPPAIAPLRFPTALLTPAPSRPTSPSPPVIAEEPVPKFHLLLPLRPTFTSESIAVHRAFGGSELSLLSPPGEDAEATPRHDCAWEEGSAGGAEREDEEPEEVVEKGRLGIENYERVEGSFGQGCGDYQYLRIGWSELA